jgi:nucleoside-diphosphate-sugar epimerase
LVLASKKLLVFGGKGFTGRYIVEHFGAIGYDVYVSCCDIVDLNALLLELADIRPDFIINLAGISFTDYSKSEDLYRVNTIGAINILDALVKLKHNPQKVILVSSATIYGKQNTHLLDESLCPTPINHYGASKLAMENLSHNYFDKLNIIITRPFNYIGIGQEEYFLIPKIVKHFKEKRSTIQLGNTYVSREFNDIEFVIKAYERLLNSPYRSNIVNICSNRAIKLLDIISIMQNISHHTIKVEVNPEFVRKNEIEILTGSSKKLYTLIGHIKQKSIENTLQDMYEA